MQIQIADFNKALDQAKQLKGRIQLLLGNGFSIACHSSFKYGTLFDQARKSGLPRHLRELLERYGSNFEDVLKYLDEGIFLSEHYRLKKDKRTDRDMAQDHKKLKDTLIKTISDNHPDFPRRITDNKFKSCIKFLRNFDAVFTVNYDLLLYWASLHINEKEGEEFPFSDGFGRDEDVDDPDCSFSYSRMGSKPFLFFLHGALHLYTRDGRVWKRVWNTTGIPIIKRVREAFKNKGYPLVVTEGNSVDKFKKIESSSYLSQAYRKFKNLQGHLFIFGHSLSDQDKHILDAVICSEKFKLSYVWIGIHGDPTLMHNQKIIEKAAFLRVKREERISKRAKLKEEGELNICFFDSDSAHVWG